MTRNQSSLASSSASSSDDSGVALVMVVGSMLVLAMLAMVALAYTMSSQKFARYDQDYAASIVAAQSGVEDYVSRLNRNDIYGQSLDCTNDALKGPTTVANLCSWDTNTAPGWLPVTPGETDPNAAWFHYQVDASNAKTQGTIVLTVTGRVHGVYRTTEVAVGKGGSTDYVYYTDVESADPTNVQAYTGTVTPACGGGSASKALYWYTGRSSAGCTEIQFATNDTLDGTVFSNDAIWSVGGTFKTGVLTANPTCTTATSAPATWVNCLRAGSSSTNFNGKQPLKVDPKYLDDTSAAFAAYPGCHYYGSTRIVFNAGGTMTVWNKKVNNGNVAPLAIAPPGGSAPLCGLLDDLDNDLGATVAVPSEMVIYVAASGVTKRQCYKDEIGGPSGSRLPLGTYDSTKVAAPTGSGQSYTVDTNMTETTKFCGQGNVYVEGILKGRTTIASAQSIIVTGDLVLAGGVHQTSAADMLGLVATNSVEIFHPWIGTVSSTKVNSWCSGSGCAYKWDTVSGGAEVSGWPRNYTDPATGVLDPNDGVQVTASIQTLQHSFLVQKYAFGTDQGTLQVFGSIAQRYRGIVRKGVPGYTKNYLYDPRLKYSSPPYFPRWKDSQWSLRYSGEVNTSTAVRNSSP